MNLSDQTEMRLVRALLDPTSTSFALLYDAYSPALYGVLLRLVHDQARAEDLLQDAFIKIWSNREHFDPKQGRLFTWLLTITRHVALDELRAQKVRTAASTYMYDRSDKEVRPALPEGKVDRALLSHLAPKYQAVVELMYYRDYTSLEAAEKLELPLGTVKTRVRKAIQELRSHFRNDIYHYQAS
ncbi:sigma-70 family RNA polymerase sigma factor [Spirosoma horti]